MSNIPRPIHRRIEHLPTWLFLHLHRVKDVAAKLASLHSLDENRATFAGLCHDMARSMSGSELMNWANELSIPIHPVEKRLPVLLHGPVASELLRQRDGIDDKEILHAIYWHSTGHPELTAIGKLVFLADKLDPEKARRFTYFQQLETAAFHDLDRALLLFLTNEIAAYIGKGRIVHPASLDTRNHLLMAREI